MVRKMVLYLTAALMGMLAAVALSAVFTVTSVTGSGMELNDKPYEKHMVEAVHMEPMGEVTLGKDEIFVLSDDRSSSMDSRNEAIGIIDIGECIGKVCFH